MSESSVGALASGGERRRSQRSRWRGCRVRAIRPAFGQPTALSRVRHPPPRPSLRGGSTRRRFYRRRRPSTRAHRRTPPFDAAPERQSAVRHASGPGNRRRHRPRRDRPRPRRTVVSAQSQRRALPSKCQRRVHVLIEEDDRGQFEEGGDCGNPPLTKPRPAERASAPTSTATPSLAGR